MDGGASEVAVGVREGDILAGKYRIDKVLGAGGMGVVVAAHHIRLDEKVAIKFLLPEALGSGEALARFEREARAAVKIKSEHVARVIDVGTLDSGAPYMVMEYLEGGDLSAWVQLRGALPIEQAVEFVLQASEAIADAHGLGIVHRDLKPANLFCVRRSDALLAIKVLDFGISKVTRPGSFGPSQGGMTKTSAVMGSPHYMSPEQMTSSKEVDARTDIWSLGVILYELLAGVVPFTGESLPEVCIKIANEQPPPIRSLRPELPDGLVEVIHKCLQKNRDDRYRNVAELAVALAPFGPKRARASVERISRVIQAAGLSASALDLPPSSEPTEHVVAPGTAAAWGHTAPPEWGRSKGLAVAAVVVLAMLGGGALATRRLLSPRTTEPLATVVKAEAPSITVAPAPAVVAAPLPAAAASTVDVAPAVSATKAVVAAPVAGPAPGRGHTAKQPAAPAHPQAAAPTPVAAPAPAPPKVSCDLPYVIDRAGHRQYKPECLK